MRQGDLFTPPNVVDEQTLGRTHSQHALHPFLRLSAVCRQCKAAVSRVSAVKCGETVAQSGDMQQGSEGEVSRQPPPPPAPERPLGQFSTEILQTAAEFGV